MKSLLMLIPAAMLLASCGNNAKSPVEQKDTTVVSSLSYFGDTIAEQGAITGSELMTMMGGKDSANVKFTASISEVCQKKGCWMDVKLDDTKNMTVRFKDYAFFVPKDAAGKTAIVEGMVRREVASVEWLKHKAEDAGKSKEEIAAITQPDTSLSFEANGVIIK